RRAADIAEEAGRPEALAHAALGYGGRFIWGRAGADPAVVVLLERALAAVGREDSPARVRLLARLAAALRDERLRERRLALAEEAVEMARRIGDPETLAYALDGCFTAVEGPDNISERLAGLEELIALGEQIGDKERVYVGHDYRLHTFWTLGDRAGVDLELDNLAALAGELRQPAQRWHVSASRTVHALMEGRFDLAGELIAEAADSGRQGQSWNAAVSQRLALFVLRRAQGRLAEVEGAIERSVHEFPALVRFRCALAHLYGELGREREARAVFDDLMAGDLAHEYLDAEWLFSMNLLPDVCSFLGDGKSAARLYKTLLPYERLYAEAPVEAAFGCMARGLGVLGTMLRRFDDAERQFEGALMMERRMRAAPWLAHVQHDYAAMLFERAGTGDEERARELLAEAVSGYRALGMDTWVRRARALSPRYSAAR
ncbi:MAG: eukaryotic-like serine/threonine-protein kinase, partial [Thermoleophilaceae bacterium]|nr:eukaryotic-like serine/threonine-protein kinase [Thermoleophilaceae bacterium]